MTRQYLHLLEEGNVLGDSVSAHGLHTGVDTAQTLVREHLLACLVVAVAVEDHLRVGGG